ncbi:MAG: NAD-dependent epimerase/dehydratase family protein [Oscillospiraceae bacterium]|jgi:nucleoside-diphosphate-sugar epimerase|nr:NAD-dependent epimerase/dehydratase family protein [Oscillospiraceae bacterium]
MKLLILGGTGVISSAIVGQGLAQGHEITVVNRGSRVSPFAGQIRCIQADRKDTAAFAAKMDKVRADIVIDMISFNPDDAEQTVRLFRDKADQLIFTSSSAAYQRPYRSLPIREEQELLSTSPDFPYGFYKAEMERYLQREMAKGDIPITIIRPSLTFGVGAANIGVLRQNYNIVRRMRDHLPLLMIGEGTIPWSFTFSDDLAKGFLLCCKNPRAYNQAFHITNTQKVLWEDLYRAIGELIGETPEFCYVSSQALYAACPDMFAHFWYEKRYPSVFSNDKILSAAPEYAPSITLKEGLSSILDWWEKGAGSIDREKWELEDAACRCAQDFQNRLRSVFSPV